jgi:hypothetical protein
MKKLTIATLLITGLGVSGIANADINASTEKDLVQICKALKSDSRLKLVKAMKRSRIRYETVVADGLVCNGQEALDFAVSHGSHKVAVLVAKRANVDLDTLLAKR